LRSFLIDSIPFLDDIELIVLDEKERGTTTKEKDMKAKDVIEQVMSGSRVDVAVASAIREQGLDNVGPAGTPGGEDNRDKITARARELYGVGMDDADVAKTLKSEFPGEDGIVLGDVAKAAKDMSGDAGSEKDRSGEVDQTTAPRVGNEDEAGGTSGFPGEGKKRLPFGRKKAEGGRDIIDYDGVIEPGDLADYMSPDGMGDEEGVKVISVDDIAETAVIETAAGEITVNLYDLTPHYDPGGQADAAELMFGPDR
jgi:hypothetical protein